MNFKIIIFCLYLLGLTFFGIENICAQDDIIVIPCVTKYCTIQEILAAIANFIFWIGIIIMPIIIIIAGIMFATSGGAPLKVKRAREMLLYASIGLSILLLARVLAEFIKDILGG